MLCLFNFHKHNATNKKYQMQYFLLEDHGRKAPEAFKKYNIIGSLLFIFSIIFLARDPRNMSVTESQRFSLSIARLVILFAPCGSDSEIAQ